MVQTLQDRNVGELVTTGGDIDVSTQAGDNLVIAGEALTMQYC